MNLEIADVFMKFLYSKINMVEWYECVSIQHSVCFVSVISIIDYRQQDTRAFV